MPIRPEQKICIYISYNVLRNHDNPIVNNFSINHAGSLQSWSQTIKIWHFVPVRFS
jgi:hypothetical protein